MIPPMSQPESPAEFTLKAVVTGVVLGIVFGAANAYLGLRVGMTVSASIPAAVMTVAAFRLFRSPGTILEANLSQTVASASTSLATGTIFTIPALFLWGMVPPYLQVVALAFLGGLLGLSAMIPLRRLLIVQAHDELPYPEGTACAEVLRATSREKDGVASGSVWIFRGMAVGAAVKVLISLVYLVPGELHAALPGPAEGRAGARGGPRAPRRGLHPRLPAVRRLRGGRPHLGGDAHPAHRVAGREPPGPALPGDGAARLADERGRHLGALRALHRGGGGGHRRDPHGAARPADHGRGLPGRGAGPAPRRERQRAPRSSGPTATCRPGSCSAASRPSCSWPASCPASSPGDMAPVQRAVLAAGVGVFGVLFVTVAARIVGIVGVSSQPTSGIALVTLLGTAVDLRRRGLGRRRRAGRRPDRRHDRGDRRQQGRRHLAGPEDRLARRRDARAPAARAADRRRLRLLGGGGDGAPARQGLHLRLAGSWPRRRPR